jgi:hypothetical protein
MLALVDLDFESRVLVDELFPLLFDTFDVFDQCLVFPLFLIQPYLEVSGLFSPRGSFAVV